MVRRERLVIKERAFGGWRITGLICEVHLPGGLGYRPRVFDGRVLAWQPPSLHVVLKKHGWWLPGKTSVSEKIGVRW
jgi:hypothetical protein